MRNQFYCYISIFFGRRGAFNVSLLLHHAFRLGHQDAKAVLPSSFGNSVFQH